LDAVSRCLAVLLRKLRKTARRYGYRGLKIFTSLSLRFQDFQRMHLNLASMQIRRMNKKFYHKYIRN
ncbi:MAG: hypothetical protein WC856_04635, partial [Methylococcaceae bacterium]